MFNKYIDNLLKEMPNIYAHKKDDKKELLLEHMELTYKYYLQIEESKKLDTLVTNIISDICTNANLDSNTIKTTYEFFKAAIYYHDIGKINPNFQKVNMDNKLDFDFIGDTSHSLISARIYLDAYKRQIFEKVKCNEYGKKDAEFLIYMIFYFSYIISRHHSKLLNFDEYLSKISLLDLTGIYDIKFPEEEMKSIYTGIRLDKFRKKFGIDDVLLYMLNELLYSVLVVSDFFATYEFMNSKKVDIAKGKNDRLFENYENSNLYKLINDYKVGQVKLDGINKLRSDLFIETESNLLKNLDKFIFYLEAPTGSGKTNMAINLARILYSNNKDINSINYIFPFNTLIDQTRETFCNYFSEYKDFIVINSCTALVDEKEENLDYEMAYIKSEFGQYSIKLSSHVNLFDIMFGLSKSAKYNLYDLINSVVVLDEIQAYSNKVWQDMITLLYKFGKYFNIKFVIMSATLPKLSYLLNKDINSELCELVSNKEKYFNDKLFKSRVKLDFSMLNLEGNSVADSLIEKVLEYKDKKVLIEFITKKSSSYFYKRLKELNVENVFELTGDDNEYTRNKIISKVKENDKIILVATQTIEAGVDIDMDIGFKDISFLDSEEQFLGRINRSAKKLGCMAYFFDLDDENKIYKNDYRADYTIRDDVIKSILISKDFDEYYKKVMDKIYHHTNKYNSNNFNNLYEYCGKLDFDNVNKRLKLIDSNTIQIFLNYTIEIAGNLIVGEDIWKEYKRLVCDKELSYAVKKVEISKLKPKFNLFLFNVYKNNNTNYYDEEFGGIYYIKNGKDFVDDGKFNREKYSNYTGGIFL